MVVEGDATEGAGLHSVEVVETKGDKVLDLPHCAFLLSRFYSALNHREFASSDADGMHLSGRNAGDSQAR